MAEDEVEYYTVKWKYIQADLLQRHITEVFVEKELKEALCQPDVINIITVARA